MERRSEVKNCEGSGRTVDWDSGKAKPVGVFGFGAGREGSSLAWV